jgi:hypothetical protein
MKNRTRYDFEEGLEDKYLLAADLIEDVWIHIDWEDIGAGRRMKIYSELEGQIKGLSRCYSSMEKFLNKLCLRFKSHLFKYETVEVLKDEKIQQDIMQIFRTETQIPLLLLKLRKEKRKELKEEKESQPNLL